MKIILTEILLRRFWTKVRKEDFHWIWTGAKDSSGYGNFTILRETIGAHIISYLIKYKKVPGELYVLHKNICHTRLCVNPDHLYLGSAKDNYEDQVKIGNSIFVKQTKVSDDDVREIFKMRAEGHFHSSIMEKFNLSSAQVSRILTRKRRANVILS